MWKITVVTIGSLLSACSMVGPDYKEPQKNIAPRWLHTNAQVTPRCMKTMNWWQTFHDPTLTSLINLGYRRNLTLQIAGVHVLQTRAQLAQSVGMFYPQQQQMMGNLTYQRMGGSSLQDILPSNFNTAALGFSANWELDFWGKYRRAILSNDASFLSSNAAYDNALVTLTADIASAYISIRTKEELIKVIKQNIQVQKASLQIANSRFKAGQVSLLDVTEAQTELAKTQAQLPPQISALQQQKDRLAVLLGMTPNDIDPLLTKSYGIPKTSSKVAVGIPRETLAQRPDIYQARLDAIAQSEAIGAIKAELFPSISLSGSFVFASNTIGNNSLGELFNWSNRSISAGPSFIWPLLNYGQITNAVRVQDAKFEEMLLKYLNLVLKAQQEVQDNITQYIETQKAEKSLVKANQAATQTVKLALIRYVDDQNAYLFVLDAERQQLQVQTSLTNAMGDIPLALVALYRSLGGGWQIRNGYDIVPLSLKSEMAARTNWGDLLEQPNHQPPKSNSERIKQIFIPSW